MTYSKEASLGSGCSACSGRSRIKEFKELDIPSMAPVGTGVLRPVEELSFDLPHEY